MEAIEKQTPKVWRLINDRPFRLVILFMVFVALASDLRENLKHLNIDPPSPHFSSPQIPMPVPSAADQAVISGQSEKISNLENENKKLSQEIEPVRRQLQSLQASRCWAGLGHWVDLGEHPPAGAKWSLEVPVVCNHQLNGPWQVAMAFDGTLISGMVVLDGPMSMDGGNPASNPEYRLPGRIFSSVVNHPTIPAYTPITLEVWSESQIHPLLKKGTWDIRSQQDVGH